MSEYKTVSEILEQVYQRAVAAEVLDLAKELEPWEIVCNARVHLSNGLMDEGDVQSWFEMGQIQDCLTSGKTEPCACCGEMEGMHIRVSWQLYCRTRLRHAGARGIVHGHTFQNF